jgi:hypothetical protein
MGLHSGKWAAVNGISTLRHWTVSETQAPAMGRASNTGFAPVRKKGVRSWSGQYTAYGAQPQCMPGTIFGFTGFSAPDDDVSGAGQTFTGNAIVDSVSMTWNWGNGEYLGHTVNFSGHLALTKGTGVMPVDAAVPDMPPVALCKIQTGAPDGSGYADLPNVVTVTLNISSSNQSFVNSSTIVGGVLWTGKKAGLPDWNLSISQQDNQRVGAPFDIGDNISIKLFTDATLFWLLQWGHVRDFTGIDANRETGAILARTINIDQTALDTTALGLVVMPSGTQWWPFV